ncbi:MS18A protein, partial [Cettia cetti]|nr:MS18A protein [Cettia cetti]
QQEQQEQWADAAPMPMVFMCAGCRRPVGDTSSWVLSDEESGCILLRSAAPSVVVDPERKLSKLPGEYG